MTIPFDSSSTVTSAEPAALASFAPCLRSFSVSARSSSASSAFPCRYANASPAVSASMRRAPEPTELSDVITNGPISAVQRTCVPPQSSREKPGISTTRTSSPYFSPKSIIAPSFFASSIGVTNVCTGRFSNTLLVDDALDLLALVGGQRLAVSEVEAQLVRPNR